MNFPIEIFWLVLIGCGVVFAFINAAKEKKYELDNKPSALPENEWPEIYVWKDREPWE